MQSSILEWSRSTKRLVVVVMDVALALLAMWLAFSLRLDMLHRPTGAQWLLYALAPLLAIPIFAWMGPFHQTPGGGCAGRSPRTAPPWAGF